jgi:hypothetical protein
MKRVGLKRKDDHMGRIKLSISLQPREVKKLKRMARLRHRGIVSHCVAEAIKFYEYDRDYNGRVR